MYKHSKRKTGNKNTLIPLFLKKIFSQLFWLAPLVVFIFIFLWLLNIWLPSTGHDYAGGQPIFAYNFWHYYHYGLQRFMFNPFHCGGMVVFADPHDIYYSIFQLLYNFFLRWHALQITIIITLFFGYLGWYLFGRQAIKLPKAWSHLLALIIVSNGYYFSHIIVGHLSFHLLPLAGWLFWLFFRNNQKNTLVDLLLSGCIFGIIVALMLYGAGWFCCLLSVFGFILATPIFISCNKNTLTYILTLIIRSLVFSIFTLGICASKLVAVFSFMKHFPRAASLDIASPDVNIFWFVAKSFWAIPQHKKYFYGLAWDIHEKSDFISLVVVLGFLLIPILLFVHRKDIFKHKLFSIFLLLYSTLFVFFVFQFTRGYGWLVSVFHKLPVFSSQHVATRYLYVFATIIAVTGVYLLYLYLKRFSNFLQIIFVYSFCIITVTSFTLAYKPVIGEFALSISLNDNLHAEKLFRDIVETNFVSEIIDHSDITNTNLYCLDVLLSHNGSPHHKALKLGPVTMESDGYFNLMNPACYVYPEENGCSPGDRIKAEDKENFEAFRSGKKTTWKLSKLQIISDYITLTTLVIMVAIFIVFTIIKAINHLQTGRNKYI